MGILKKFNEIIKQDHTVMTKGKKAEKRYIPVSSSRMAI